MKKWVCTVCGCLLYTSYSIADEGVVSFRILQNGSLARLNSAPIRGMRGCHLCTDKEDKYVFVSGYHDGKTTVLSLNKDGSVGQIVDEVFNKGYGSCLLYTSSFRVRAVGLAKDT